MDRNEQRYQAKMFHTWWRTPIVRELEKLPEEGSVREYRIPYSGHDYPDGNGGTDVPVGRMGVSPLRKYDHAFNEGQLLATRFEREDIASGRRSYYVTVPNGWFSQTRRLVTSAPGWYGHCNGWTAATIRHAEPQQDVVRNGVTFTPADIKALLADIYMYTETEHLGGVDHVINPGTLHITLANWLGRAEHPVGVEATPGKVVYNYPIYAYKTSIVRHSNNQAEVRLTAIHAVNTRYEGDASTRLRKPMYFHYLLDLDENGEITGGSYFRDSQQVDMLWTPLKPVPGGEAGNERGNPHIDVDEVMAMWRESVPKELREKWLNVDPLPKDAKLGEEAQPLKLWGGWKPRRKG
jgi:hypothetical protein